MEKIVGVDGGSVDNCRVMKRGLAVMIALVGLGLTSQTARADFDPIFGFYRPELFATVDGDALLRNLPLTGFLNGSMPGSTSLGRMGTAPIANFPIALVSAEPKHPRGKANSVSGPVIDPKDGKDYSSVESLAMEKASLSWTGGEVGFLYGHSTGKFGGDLFSTYITGGVGNDHMQINVGAGYEESHFSRSRH
jgi:hypothetical protein